MQHTHEQYMLRCLELARLGAGKVAPNPMVGCVIVYDGKIIGEGWHQNYGGPHAEVNAINAVADKSVLPQSTVYVSLEPCAHFGKTPPCADLLVKHAVGKVVIGMIDPFSEVAGKGIEKLKAAGIEVVVGILEEACKELNKRFIVFNEQKRPYVILKWAQTADGYLAPDPTGLSTEAYNDKRHITGKTVQVLVHKWRGEEAAIMVGTRTAMIDDPKLDTRAFPGKNPIRVIIDKNLALPDSLNVFDGSQRTIIFTAQLVQPGKNNIEYIVIDFDKAIWPQILSVLYNLKIQSIIVEGGLITLQSILESNLWDEIQQFTATKKLNGGVKAPEARGLPVEEFTIDSSVFKRYQNK